MHKIKKYANGRLYDTTNKKYITLKQLSEMIQKGEKISIVLTKTGADITSSVISKLSVNRKPAKEASGNATDIIKWLGDNIDKRVAKILGVMNLATRKEVSDLTTTIESLTIKIKKLERLQAARARKLKKAQMEKAKKAEDFLIQEAVKLEKQNAVKQEKVHQTAVASMAQ
jgi:polyhydroxyalkanoate synthesis regulator protein